MRLAIALILALPLAAQAETYRNVRTQQGANALPAWSESAQANNPTFDSCRGDDWRYQIDPPAPSAGYERLSGIVWIDADGTNATAQYTDTLIADRLAAEAAAAAQAASNEVIRLQTPLVFDQMIEAPRIIIPAQTNGTPAYGIVIDVDGNLVTYQDHASPRTNEVANANMKAALTNQADIVATLRAMKATCTNNIAVAQAVKDAAVLLDISAFTGAQSNAIKRLRAAIADSDQLSVDNAQEINKLRRAVLRWMKVNEQ